jgi:hypothetical protein
MSLREEREQMQRLNKLFASHAGRERDGLASAEWVGGEAGRPRHVDC